MAVVSSPVLTLNDGRTMPQLGFGLWQVPGDDTGRVVAEALGIGYRLVDGAAIYGNEAGLGEGLRRAGLPRGDVFVTSKVWNDAQGHDAALRAIDESLARIGTDYLDLCLIHWPVPGKDLYVETWRALIAAREAGKVRSVGVSNFNADHLDRIIGETGVTPAVNQIELHPRFQQPALRARHAALGIVTQSWTPLGRSACFDAPAVAEAARRLSRSRAQVILRWHIDLGLSVIPRSTHAGRLAENFALFDFALGPSDLAAMAALDAGDRLGPDPLTFA